ncbi:Uncharacterised protein [Vibrio cholerae]|nr:Uncharacterised protein [Vibrio cholerae]
MDSHHHNQSQSHQFWYLAGWSKYRHNRHSPPLSLRGQRSSATLRSSLAGNLTEPRSFPQREKRRT